MKILILIAGLLLSVTLCSAQYHVSSLQPGNRVQLGVSGKLSLEVQRHGVHVRFGATGGVGAPVAGSLLYPAANLEWQVYEGGLGTWSGSHRSKSNFTSDLVGSLQCTIGGWYQPNRLGAYALSQRNEPLYYFTDQVQPALQNPYLASFTVGTNFVYSFDPDRYHHWQRVGFIALHGEHVQFSYYNDGGGFQSIGIGDGEDRYYTGGGMLSLTLPNRFAVNTLTASYHKFSGFTPKAFALSSGANLSFVNYTDTVQQYYNKSYWNFAVAGARSGLSGFFRINNAYNRSDFQNTIHYSFGYSYHHIPYPRYYSFGVSYFNVYQQTGTQ